MTSISSNFSAFTASISLLTISSCYWMRMYSTENELIAVLSSSSRSRPFSISRNALFSISWIFSSSNSSNWLCSFFIFSSVFRLSSFPRRLSSCSCSLSAASVRSCAARFSSMNALYSTSFYCSSLSFSSRLFCCASSSMTRFSLSWSIALYSLVFSFAFRSAPVASDSSSAWPTDPRLDRDDPEYFCFASLWTCEIFSSSPRFSFSS